MSETAEDVTTTEAVEGQSGTDFGDATSPALEVNGHDPEEATPGAKFFRTLRVPLSPQQLAELVHQAQAHVGQISALEGALDSTQKTAKRLKNEIEEHQVKVNSLVSAADAGTTSISVECQEILDYRSNAVRIVRLDTNEVVEERAMEFDERQRSLLPDEPPTDPPTDEQPQEYPDPDRAYEEARDHEHDWQFGEDGDGAWYACAVEGCDATISVSEYEGAQGLEPEP